jgi:hypothetical protein
VPISKINSESQNEVDNGSLPKHGIKLFGLIILDIIFISSILIFVLIIYLIVNSQHSRINHLSGWMISDYGRFGQSLGILFDATLLIGMTTKQINISYVKIESLQRDILKVSVRIPSENSFLLGNGHLPSIIVENSDFDKYNIHNNCDKDAFSQEVIDSYSCSGLIHNYELVASLANSIAQNYPHESFSNGSNWFHIHQIMNKYLRIPQSYSINAIVNVFFHSIEDFHETIIINLVCGMILYFFVLLLFDINN